MGQCCCGTNENASTASTNFVIQLKETQTLSESQERDNKILEDGGQEPLTQPQLEIFEAFWQKFFELQLASETQSFAEAFESVISPINLEEQQKLLFTEIAGEGHQSHSPKQTENFLVRLLGEVAGEFDEDIIKKWTASVVCLNYESAA